MGCCGWGVGDRIPTVRAVAPPTDPRHLVAFHRARAEVALMESSEGASLCRIEGPGRVEVKRAEGRLFAIVELERALRASVGNVNEVVAELTGQWREQARQVSAGSEGWSACRAGGVAELEAVAGELAALDGGVAS